MVPVTAQEARTVEGKEILIVTVEKKKKDDTPYSVYSVGQRRLIVLAASLAAFFSPLSANIYYPALPVIAKDLGTTNTQINLTVTTYLIIQGIAPMITAGYSDTLGRRPAYLFCFTVFTAANLGLALQNNYTALMILRCLQSAGSSGATALANGVVSDIITPQERGSYIAFACIGSVLGLTLSPTIGGLITQYLDWHCIFWFLFIFNMAFCVPFFLFFPETCRNVVGDGSIFPPPMNRCLADYVRRRKQTQTEMETDVSSIAQERPVVFNPMPTLRIFTSKETALILIPSGVAIGTLYAIVTGASSAFKTIYTFDPLRVSLMYLPIGIGSVAAALTVGKLVDWNFNRHATKLGITVTRNKQHEDLSNFPFEKARLQVALPLFFLGTACIVIYDWILQNRFSIWGPIVLLVVMSWTLTAFYQVTNLLVVDTYPGRGASVSAAVNIVRCEIGATAAALISPMTVNMGHGWAYTILAIVGFAMTPILLWTAKSGIRWRREAREKELARKPAMEAKADRPSEEEAAEKGEC